MTESPKLARITIFPFKSFDGINLTEVDILENGALENDRRFVFKDDKEKQITAKIILKDKSPKMQQLRSNYNITNKTLSLHTNNTNAETFHVDTDCTALEDWISNYFDVTAILEEDKTGGYPDSKQYFGPSIISTATLARVAEWFDLDIDETRKRFRTNLEIDGVSAFWEDRLCSPKGEGISMTIGKVHLRGMSLAKRCSVPRFNSKSGEKIDGFIERFKEKREEELPEWADKKNFDNNNYRLAVYTKYTKINEENDCNFLRVGDRVTLS